MGVEMGDLAEIEYDTTPAEEAMPTTESEMNSNESEPASSLLLGDRFVMNSGSQGRAAYGQPSQGMANSNSNQESSPPRRGNQWPWSNEVRRRR